MVEKGTGVYLEMRMDEGKQKFYDQEKKKSS